MIVLPFSPGGDGSAIKHDASLNVVLPDVASYYSSLLHQPTVDAVTQFPSPRYDVGGDPC